MQRLPVNLKAFVGVAVLTSALFTAGRSEANPQVYERTLRSTVWVMSPLGRDRLSYGTGFVVDAKRKWVVTNYHVVEERKQAVVFFPTYRGDRAVSDPEYYAKNAEKLGLAGEVIARDKKRDLALIELPSLPSGTLDMVLALRSPKPGETVHAIGSSGLKDGVLWRYSKGEVRQVYPTKFKARMSDGGALEVDALVVETQIPTNQGDSGGPVVNERGELVAVTQSNDTKQRLVSYSIDVNEVRTFLRTATSRAAK